MTEEYDKKINRIWIIISMILFLALLVLFGWIMNDKFVNDAFADGVYQGRGEVIFLNTQGRFLIFNSQTNQTQEVTLGNLCSRIYG